MRMLEHLDAIDVRHLDVSDDEIVERAINFVLGSLAGLHSFNAMALAAQSDVKHFADGTLVVANQDVSHAGSLPPRQPQEGLAQPRAVRIQASSHPGERRPIFLC